MSNSSEGHEGILWLTMLAWIRLMPWLPDAPVRRVDETSRLAGERTGSLVFRDLDSHAGIP